MRLRQLDQVLVFQPQMIANKNLIVLCNRFTFLTTKWTSCTVNNSYLHQRKFKAFITLFTDRIFPLKTNRTRLMNNSIRKYKLRTPGKTVENSSTINCSPSQVHNHRINPRKLISHLHNKSKTELSLSHLLITAESQSRILRSDKVFTSSRCWCYRNNSSSSKQSTQNRQRTQLTLTRWALNKVLPRITPLSSISLKTNNKSCSTLSLNVRHPTGSETCNKRNKSTTRAKVASLVF